MILFFEHFAAAFFLVYAILQVTPLLRDSDYFYVDIFAVICVQLLSYR